jgi:radical SAM protein with 4Fe4S-binding SPASM domain
LLDERIVELNKYAREHLPNARIHMFTNGTLFTLQKFKDLIPYLDELIIDNYMQDLKLIKPCREIKEYIEEHPELRRKVTIVLRKPQEILTSRGGDAPNRKELVSYGDAKCALPFEQMIVRPDGKVSLCCNDPIGKNTLGDLTKQSILDVWYGKQYQMIRKCISEGRRNWKHCEYCDSFYLY